MPIDRLAHRQNDRLHRIPDEDVWTVLRTARDLSARSQHELSKYQEASSVPAGQRAQ